MLRKLSSYSNVRLFFIFLLSPLLILSFDYFDQTGKLESQQQKEISSTFLKSNEFGRVNKLIEEGNNSFKQFPANLRSLNDIENVNVEIQLRGYSNQGFNLPQRRLCTCPKGEIGEHCIQASPQRTGYNCLTSLAVFVLSASSSLKYFQTLYNPLNPAGQLNAEQFSLQKFLLDSQPTAIAVLVYNLGPQIDTDGSLYETNTVTLVDSFILPLISPSGFSDFSSRGQQSVSLIGQILGTQLTFTYSISCAGGTSKDGRRLVGPGCDLNCNTTSQSTVTNCQNCPFGVKDGVYCADEQGGVLYGEVVSTFYYNAFILLCCLSGILFLLLLLTCLLYLGRNFKKEDNQNKTTGYRRPSKRSDDSALLGSTTFNPPRIHRIGPDSVPLNVSNPFPPQEDTKNIKIPSYNKNEVNRGPSPFPRSNASTTSIPSEIIGAGSGQLRFPAILQQSGGVGVQQNGKIRKTLSPPRFQPLPHLGPQQPENDVMNNSFVSSGGCRTPKGTSSVSADV
ncbi:hypothetical protein Mgra_00009322 [Meloidogyne graminicola]|uniref:Uncharacterized protein n=1 Tax=Meloidogyne graminicola TaxID=189291 RepID=A0A8S9ZD78_9BILA|nr:hypothetical protein Mgra_00009322 [Meloidogyne graminicola]